MPKYDFNWQTVYEYQEPKKIPAGSKLVWTFAWDNSTQNPGNPDPTKAVRWGDQTFEEMGIGFVRYPLPRRGSRQAEAPTQVSKTAQPTDRHNDTAAT